MSPHYSQVIASTFADFHLTAFIYSRKQKTHGPINQSSFFKQKGVRGDT